MIQFIVHGSKDAVGVAVTNIQPKQQAVGWNMETDATLQLVAVEEVPLGHKIALRDVSAGEGVLKYNVQIGKAVTEIQVGQHVHTHNLKTARW